MQLQIHHSHFCCCTCFLKSLLIILALLMSATKSLILIRISGFVCLVAPISLWLCTDSIAESRNKPVFLLISLFASFSLMSSITHCFSLLFAFTEIVCDENLQNITLYVIAINNKRIAATAYVTGPAKTGHICTNYTCLENGTFLGHYLW